MVSNVGVVFGLIVATSLHHTRGGVEALGCERPPSFEVEEG